MTNRLELGRLAALPGQRTDERQTATTQGIAGKGSTTPAGIDEVSEPQATGRRA
jgi:hypothetical protein